MSTKKNFVINTEIPENMQINLNENIIKLKGPKGEVEKKLHNPFVKIEIKDKEIILSTKGHTKNEKRVINTFKSHINNLIKGVNETYIYKLKICSTHFPITAVVEKDKVVIKNFMGEKVPRKSKILPNVVVKVNGEVIIVESSNKEAAGQTAANIEKSCRRTKFDTRVFADGVWMFHKSGKDIK